MPLKVLIVPDKFKGTLTAQAAAEAIARGWKISRPGDAVDLLPMSDGGDGFGEILSRLMRTVLQTVSTVDAAHRPLVADWWWAADTKTAIIESAKVIGLARLPPQKFHPFELDTLGLGAVLRSAAEKGAEHFLFGIGGSATNDGGFGLARALGWSFLNERDGQPIQRWTELWSLKQLLTPKDALRWPNLRVAVDVQNSLLGPAGASRIYGPQKGLAQNDMTLAERCLSRLAEVAQAEFHRDFASEPGSGAAGGLGFGLRCFLGAQLERGFGLFAEYSQLLKRLSSAQMVITGEGAIDQSSMMGKGVGEIANLCCARKVPCIGLAGVLGDSGLAKQRFTQLHGLTPGLTTEEQAKSRSAFWLEQLAAAVARNWK